MDGWTNFDMYQESLLGISHLYFIKNMYYIVIPEGAESETNFMPLWICTDQWDFLRLQYRLKMNHALFRNSWGTSQA